MSTADNDPQTKGLWVNGTVATLLAGVTSATGQPLDVRLAGGVIASITPADHEPTAEPDSDIEVMDLRGYVVLPAMVEPHAHLDKALLAERIPNPTLDLEEAIGAVQQAYESMTAEDIDERATRAALTAVAHGCLTVRSHADCDAELGVRAVEALLRVKQALREVISIQIVALAGRPIAGPDGAANRRALRAALEAGADLVGGAPALDADPTAAIRELLAAAADTGKGLDLHTDETTDPAATSLLDLARAVSTARVPGPVTASHCVSLGSQEPKRAAEIAQAVADAGIGVVTLPQTNLYLQGRGMPTRTPRGLTAIDVLRRAGVLVAGGGDNLRDPFNPMGSGDPLETAMLLVVAGHLSPADAYAAVSERAYQVLGLAPIRLEPGASADLVAVRGESLVAVLADRTPDRLVFRGGRLLVRTTVTPQWQGVQPRSPETVARALPQR